MKRPSAWSASCPGSYRHSDRTVVARAPPWRTCEPGMVIDPSRDLDLGATGQEHPAHHVHLPQARRPRPPTAGNPPVGAACARSPGHDAPAPAASPRSAPPPARASDAGRTGAEGRSASPPSPSSAYRRSRPCTVCRATPYRWAASVTETPSRALPAPPGTAAPPHPAPPAHPTLSSEAASTPKTR